MKNLFVNSLQNGKSGVKIQTGKLAYIEGRNEQKNLYVITRVFNPIGLL